MTPKRFSSIRIPDRRQQSERSDQDTIQQRDTVDESLPSADYAEIEYEFINQFADLDGPETLFDSVDLAPQVATQAFAQTPPSSIQASPLTTQGVIQVSPQTPDATQASLQSPRGATQVAPQPQAIASRASDPIRERFYEMRSLAVNNPFAYRDVDVFYRQAQFMADFTDDYWDYAEFNMYYPSYQRMGYHQLRTYFTWRTTAREGTFRTVSLSYIFLYVYELLAGVGVSDAAEGLEKLTAVWEALRLHEPALD